MRYRLGRGRNGRRAVQGLLPFAARGKRLDRKFKRAITFATVIVLAVFALWGRRGRELVRGAPRAASRFVERLVGIGPSREEVAALSRSRRRARVDEARESLRRYYQGAGPVMRSLFDATAMSPGIGVVGAGRADDAFVLSSDVYAQDGRGRSFRLLPDTRSVWLRGVTARGAPLGFFLVRDSPEVRSAAARASATFEEHSVQTTNSWGLRGPEPDVNAPARCLVLGDSFMQGMFIGDDDTPLCNSSTPSPRSGECPSRS